MKKSFGFNKEGKEVFLYTIENANIRMSVMDYGATIVSLVNKNTDIDVMLGFDDLNGYMGSAAHIGATIGRTANRTKDAKFELNGKTYYLENNNNGNNLHGGSIGFDKVIWDIEEGEDQVVFSRLSPDGEFGYPGNMKVKVTYKLLDNGADIIAEAEADEDTLFAWTNHAYFNVDGSLSVMDQEVKLEADQYSDCDLGGISDGIIRNVENTPFDFREFKKIGKDINDLNENIKRNHGYDHHFVIRGEGMRKIAECRGEKQALIISSNLPGVHMYTANFLNEEKGKGGTKYEPHAGVCFEPEYYPNAINYKEIEPKPILKKGEISVSNMRIEIKEL